MTLPAPVTFPVTVTLPAPAMVRCLLAAVVIAVAFESERVFASLWMVALVPSVMAPVSVLLPEVLRIAPLPSPTPLMVMASANAVKVPESESTAPSAIVVLPAVLPSEVLLLAARVPVEIVVAPV